jgi:hypothetical protein
MSFPARQSVHKFNYAPLYAPLLYTIALIFATRMTQVWTKPAKPVRHAMVDVNTLLQSKNDDGGVVSRFLPGYAELLRRSLRPQCSAA